jgi:hypothetical protein
VNLVGGDPFLTVWLLASIVAGFVLIGVMVRHTLRTGRSWLDPDPDNGEEQR